VWGPFLYQVDSDVVLQIQIKLNELPKKAQLGLLEVCTLALVALLSEHENTYPIRVFTAEVFTHNQLYPKKYTTFATRCLYSDLKK